MPPLLRCVGPPTDPQAPGGFIGCDAAHRVITATSALASPSDDTNPPDIPLPDEPYALALDAHDGLLFIGHLSGNTTRPYTGGFSVFDIAPGGTAGETDQPGGRLGTPRFIAPFPSPFAANSVGSVGVTALNLNKDDGTVYASSRYVPQVAGLGTTAQCPVEGAPVREIAAFPNGQYYNPPLAGSETRGIQFVDGSAFVLQRSPPALVRFLPSNSPQYPGTPTDILETCSSPTFLDKYDSGVGERLFVTCFADGEIYVYDPALPRLVKTFPVGRGPSGLVFDESRNVAYVVGFGDNNISVIDLAPGSPTEYHVVQHIGFPRVTPR
jgi:DNA-binding beta-propeller fold protein YncE